MTETNAWMEGKIVLVTGGTGGIGKATATGLAGLGARVIVVGRSRARGEAGAADIKTESGNGDVELILADLSSQAEVRRLAGEIEARHARLDVLINNVGGVYAERRETPDGIEATLAMNLTSPFLLTGLLLPMLQRSAPSRVVNVSAPGHRFARLDLGDPQSGERYGMMDALGWAKLAGLLWTYELARRLEDTGVTANAADPGQADTETARSVPPSAMPWWMATMNRLTRPVASRFATPERAARGSVYLASAAEMEGVNGKYYNAFARPARSSRASYDEAAARHVWRMGEELTGLPAPRISAS